MKEFVNPFDYAKEINYALEKGILLTTKAGDKVNTMTIGWGMMGIQWNKPIFIALVRGCRHTYSMLEQNPEFTVNIPLSTLDKNIIRVCGTKSGADCDKFQELGLTTETPEKISVPGICQLPLTLECKVLYKQQQYPEHLLSGEPLKFYKENPESIQDDYHTAYYGEIVSAYIIR